MKRILFLVVVAAVVSGSALLASAKSHHGGPETIDMPALLGDVTFDHYVHQGKISDCTECHHQGEDKGKCTGCHGVDENIPTAKKAFHDQCKGCHKNSAGPTTCKGCHIKE